MEVKVDAEKPFLVRWMFASYLCDNFGEYVLEYREVGRRRDLKRYKYLLATAEVYSPLDIHQRFFHPDRSLQEKCSGI
jgi:hypothetical protein